MVNEHVHLTNVKLACSLANREERFHDMSRVHVVVREVWDCSDDDSARLRIEYAPTRSSIFEAIDSRNVGCRNTLVWWGNYDGEWQHTHSPIFRDLPCHDHWCSHVDSLSHGYHRCTGLAAGVGRHCRHPPGTGLLL